jgi:uncharacterized coiled-coil protein SlyX
MKMLGCKVPVVSAVVLIAALAFPDWARGGAAEQEKKRATASEQMRAMQESIAEQTKAIQALQQQIQSRDQIIDQLQKRVDTLQDNFSAAQQQMNLYPTQNVQATALRNDVGDLKASTASEFQESQKQIENLEHPTQVRFRGITITPGGFLEAAGIYRSHNENGDVGSTFGNIPFSGTANASSVNSEGQPVNPGFRYSPRAK